jgi:hypothetical protein
MRISELLEDGTSTFSGNIASVANPHVTNPYQRGQRRHPKPRKVKPTDNALDMNVSLFGGPLQRR